MNITLTNKRLTHTHTQPHYTNSQYISKKLV